MAQVKIYGLSDSLDLKKDDISKAIHESLMDVFKLPESKQFHRFIRLDADDFIYPSDRNTFYTIIELSIFEGRSVEAKKDLIRSIFLKMKQYTKIDEHNVEITIFETPKSNWGIRGLPADELVLNYKVNV